MTRAPTSAARADATAAERERDRKAQMVPAPAFDRADHDTTGQELDWEGFCTAYFPGSRRHDFKAITAYGAYRRSHRVDRESVTDAPPSGAAGRFSTGAPAIEAWEDEGGASLSSGERISARPSRRRNTAGRDRS
jgi:hypothetical protein